MAVKERLMNILHHVIIAYVRPVRIITNFSSNLYLFKTSLIFLKTREKCSEKRLNYHLRANQLK